MTNCNCDCHAMAMQSLCGPCCHKPAAPAPPASGEQQDLDAFAQQLVAIARNARTTTDTGLLRAFRDVLDYYARSQVEATIATLAKYHEYLRVPYDPEMGEYHASGCWACKAERALRGGGR